MRIPRFVGSDNGYNINIYDRIQETLYNLNSLARKEYLENPFNPIFSQFSDIYLKKAPVIEFKNRIYNYPLKAYIMTTNACNLRCKYCYLAANTLLDKELTDVEFENLINELDGLGILLLSFNGGEPFVRPNFINTIRYVISKQMAYSISTNGTLINEEFAGLIGESSGWLKISLDGSSENHDSLRGSGTFEIIIKKLEILKKYDVNFILQMTLTSQNISDMVYLAHLGNQLGAKYIKFSLIRPSGRALDNSFLYNLSDRDFSIIEEQISLLNLIPIKKVYSHDFPYFHALHKGHNLSRIDNKLFGCSAGKTAISIHPTGEITPCIFFPSSMNAGNVRDGLKNVLDNSKIFTLMRNYQPNFKCKHCSKLKECFGGCRARAFVSTGKINGIDPFCQLLKKR